MNGDPRFDGVDLTNARFRNLDLTGARFELVNLSGMVMRGVELVDVDITGELRHVTINGVDVAPLVDAELNRRFPDRAKMRPRDPGGFREAWRITERLWAGTVARARALDPVLLHESVDGEWSFVQTLRHLVFATDAWINRVILGDPHPWDPLDLPFDQMRDQPGVPRDRDARPSLERVLSLRADRMATVRSVLDRLTVEQLDSRTEPVTEPGWPEPLRYPVRDCLLCILNEEWEHRLFAERDLDVLQPKPRTVILPSRSPTPGPGRRPGDTLAATRLPDALARTGHFAFESGHHGDTWLELDLLLAEPGRLRALCRELAEALREHEVDVVCGPLDGGAFVAQWVAEALGVAFAYTRREVADGTVRYRLPAALAVAGRRAAVVDDAINVGSATLATIAALAERGAMAVVVGSLLVCRPDGRRVGHRAGLPQAYLAEVGGAVWPAARCPLCAAGTPMSPMVLR